MRHCACLFHLFLIGFLCNVYFSACTHTSSLKESDDESPRAEHWGSDGKRILRANDSEFLLTEERILLILLWSPLGR
uniref:Secreted RxLR effector protein 31 n=1 Tax=Plasmopara viticola TaxID=143451 RepID=RLR31_PLAVT|nr:RecName: Full=Secreted RxLR effector protein 31; Flags: Precursor [Plasmopara viticola]